MQDLKMPLKTLRKETSKHLYQVKVSGHVARLASSLFNLTMSTRVTDSSVLIATTVLCVKNKCVKLPFEFNK